MLLRIFNDLSLPTPRSMRAPLERQGETSDHRTASTPNNQAEIDGENLVLSERLRTNTQSLEQDARKIADDLESLASIDDSLQRQSRIINRLRELASETATESISAAEREAINLEFEQLEKDFNQAAGQNQSTPNTETSLEALDAPLSGFSQGRTTPEEALSAMETLVQSLDRLTSLREEAGSARARLEKAQANLNITIENLSAAEPAARDANNVSELTRFAREQILAQSATAMVGQANLIPQGVFELVEES